MILSFSSAEYTKDDLPNSEKNRFESIKPSFDTNLREQTRPQGAASLPATIRKLPDTTLSDNDEDNISLTNHTLTSNLSKETNSSSEKLSNRDVRVKNDSKKQLIDHQSLHEADWYRRSIEINKDHRNEMKQIQLISNKHLSRMKFEQQKANLIENKRDNENQEINHEIAKDKKSNESLPDMINVKTRTDAYQMKRNDDKIYSTQQLPMNKKRNSDHYMQEK